MTTNYFPTLEIPLELQLKLSELIVAAPPTAGGGGEVIPWVPVPISTDATGFIVQYSAATRIGDKVTASLLLFGTSTWAGPVVIEVPLPVPVVAVAGGVGNGDPGGGVWGAIRMVAAPAPAIGLSIFFDGLAATSFSVSGVITYDA